MGIRVNLMLTVYVLFILKKKIFQQVPILKVKD